MFGVSLKVEQSIFINKSQEQVFAAVADFKQWAFWSPWLRKEPESSVTVMGDVGQVGHQHQWDGQYIGSGHVGLTHVAGYSQLGFDVSLTEPWRSVASAAFSFAPKDQGTQVTWSMRGALPWSKLLLKPMVSAMVENDCRRGLSMLKEYLETGTVPSKVVMGSVSSGPTFFYIGKREKCRLENISASMEGTFQKIKEQRPPNAELVGVFYHKYGIIRRICDYTAFFAYLTEPKVVANGLQKGRIRAHKALGAKHFGPYRFLPNAWAALIGCSRYRKFRLNTEVPMYEIYASMPGDAPEAEVETRLYFPVE